MEEEKDSSTFGTTVRSFAFDGEESKFRAWEGKTLAIASSKSFLLALTKKEPIKGLTAEEYENGEVIEPGVETTEPGDEGAVIVAAPTTRDTTKLENRRYAARSAAWTYLVASCSGKAYALIERCAGDPFAAWTILQEKYCATDAEENYPDLAEAFAACKLVEVKRDPELWFNDLDHLNHRIGKINEKYEKDDLQMKSHIMNSMSGGYDPVIVKFRGELAETSLIKIRKEIVLQYKSLLKTKGKGGSESALMAKHPFKKFKGNCRNCGKQGHKAVDCPSKSTEGGGGSGNVKSPVDKSNVTCYNCGEKGHYANKCPKPKKPKSDDSATESAMFVGVTAIRVKKSEKSDGDWMRNFKGTNEWDEMEFFGPGSTCGGNPNKFDFDSMLGRGTQVLQSIAEDSPTEIVESTCVTVVNHPRVCYAGLQAAGTKEFVGSAAAVSTETTEEWLLDSGATSGVTYDNTLMTNMRPSNRKIEIGNGDMIETLGQGTVTLTDSAGKTVQFTDVYYAPEFTKHIVSFRQLIENNWSLNSVTVDEFVWDAPMSSEPVSFKMNDKDRLCYFEGTRTYGGHDGESINSLTTAPVTLDINVAHGLLGHPDTRTVKAMAAQQGWTLTGTVKPCGSCALAKARAKAVPKSTLTKAKDPGERLFLDISGPYSDSLSQNKYWLRIVDDHTRFSWDCFLPKKSGIHVPLCKLLKMNKAAGKTCKFLRCDNAGENESHVQEVCADFDVQLEMTAPNTPQMNGVVERSFATCKNRAFATMYCAKFSLETQALLWPEAINTITKLTNSLPRSGELDSPYTKWYGPDAQRNRILDHLQPFGRVAYITNRSKIRAKLDPKSVKCVFVGYADDHSGDTYKFYNPATKATILSRDVHQWMEWHGRITATDDLPLFDQVRQLEDDVVIVPASAVMPDPDDAPATDDAEVADLDDLLDNVDMPALIPRPNSEDTEDAPTAATVEIAPQARRNLAVSFSPVVTRSKTRTGVTLAGMQSDNWTAVTSENPMTVEEFILSATLQSDPQLGVPKNYKELVRDNDPKWIKSMHGELENFLSRDAWEFLSREKLPKGRKPLHCRWIFKEKVDGTKKSRSVIKGYEQIPGVDFHESYSPLASNTTVRVTLAMSMKYKPKRKNWVTIMIDVEAAFLNAMMDTDIYIELPEGLLEYALSKGMDLRGMVIKLRRAQYGLVQSPRLWMETFTAILLGLGLIQCKTDPCLFMMFSTDGTLDALVVVYCDDCIITGIHPVVEKIKAGISRSVKISDLGNLKRHLGVDYEFGTDSEGDFIRSYMTDYVESIVRDYEEFKESGIKEFSTPGASVTPPLRSSVDDEIIDMEPFRSFVGRILFACGKTEPTISNACRELTSHLSAPNKEHWKALSHLIGFLKTGSFQGVKLRTPEDTQVVAYVDADYASDRNDRKSISGYLVTIGGCLVSWMSKKQTGVTLSSTESEFVAMSMVATEIKFVVSLLREIMGGGHGNDHDEAGSHNGHRRNDRDDRDGPMMPSILREDNTGAIFLAKNTAIGSRTKHVDVRYRFVNDMVMAKELSVQHIRSGENPSDCMTKNLPLTLFAKHAALICHGNCHVFTHRRTRRMSERTVLLFAFMTVVPYYATTVQVRKLNVRSGRVTSKSTMMKIRAGLWSA